MIKVSFSPNGGCEADVISVLNSEASLLRIAIYSFTNANIAAAILAAVKRKVNVLIIMDQSQTAGVQAKYYDQFLKAGAHVKLLKGTGSYGMMHNKFTAAGKLVTTGSFNYTQNAQFNNFENVLTLDDAATIAIYQVKFDIMFAQAKVERPSFITSLKRFFRSPRLEMSI